jgi:putative CocE/NonD family hydrolase
VTIFVMGGGSGARTPEGRLLHGGRWLRAQDWPPREAVATRWHLQPEGGLAQAAATRSASLSWRYDPNDPVPTIGGAIASGAPLMDGGAFDQREQAGAFGTQVPGRALAERVDVCVFETAPLARDVEVVGPVTATLWVSTDALDTDFTIKLVDVYPPSSQWPQGYALNLTDGILRLRFRAGFEQARLAEPGRIYKIDIVAFPTANRFRAGHRIRLDVSSSNFPHFDVNPNTGAPAGEPSIPVVATNSVHVGAEYPSHIVLHLMPLDPP